MSRPRVKLDNAQVWVLEEVVPYEGSTILGIFLDIEVAKADRPGRWTHVQSDGEDVWTTHRDGGRMTDNFFLITPYVVRTK